MKFKQFYRLCVLFALIGLLSGCASEDGIDGKLIKLDDGRVFELRHRVFDTYLLHKIDTEELEKLQKNIDSLKAR